MSSYPNTLLLIDGSWRNALRGGTTPVLNPATNAEIGTVACASIEDLDAALQAVMAGFVRWKERSAFERAKTMREAARLLRERRDRIANVMTLEQGKPLAEAKMEVLAGADIIDWFAEEARRTYGQLIPARIAGVSQAAIKLPVGPVAAFAPWNFPINQVVRKVSAALAAGCSIIVKGPEETPASVAALVQAFLDGGVPDGVINLVFGPPAEISNYLIPHPTIRKISFTGSTAVGKKLSALAGEHMKRSTMELGGHAPAIVLADADIKAAISVLSAAKFRNAGQVCIAPTRFLVEDRVFDSFLEGFVERANSIKIGDGLDPDTQMGPLAHERRVPFVQELVADALQCGAELRTGGKRLGNQGNFFEPTVLANVPKTARVMNEEPFGPIALINRVSGLEEALTEANRLPFGLASYAFTRSQSALHEIATRLEAGMTSINHQGLSIPEVPFGGIKESGYGSEGGSEAVEPYLITRFVSTLHI